MYTVSYKLFVFLDDCFASVQLLAACDDGETVERPRQRTGHHRPHALSLSWRQQLHQDGGWHRGLPTHRVRVQQVQVCRHWSACSGVQLSSVLGLATPRTYFLHLSLSSVILIDFSMGSCKKLCHLFPGDVFWNISCKKWWRVASRFTRKWVVGWLDTVVWRASMVRLWSYDLMALYKSVCYRYYC